MAPNNNCIPVPVGFSFPIPSKEFDDIDISILSGLTNANSTTFKLEGKQHKSFVNGHLSIATILVNALQLPAFPRTSYAIIQTGQLGLTFAQIDIISKRLSVIISSLVVQPGSDHQVASNNDGDSVIMIILDEDNFVNEQLIVLIFTILRLGATYMVVNKSGLTSDMKGWGEMMALINPILIITLGDPQDLPSAMRNDLNLVAREHFEDFQEEDDIQSERGSVFSELDVVPSLTSMTATSLIKKVRSSLILKPSTNNPSILSAKVIWDLAIELKIPNEKEFEVAHFKSEVAVGQRTAFIFRCESTPKHAEWCRLGHKAVRNRIFWERMEFPMRPNEKICLTFPLHDPRSLVQIFNSFIHGKPLVVVDLSDFEQPGLFLRKWKSDAFKFIYRIELTPEKLHDILDTATSSGLESVLSRVKTWIISGNRISVALAKQFFNALKSYKDIELVITYGTGEFLWCVTWNSFSSLSEVNKGVIKDKSKSVARLSMGVPVLNTTVYVVSERKHSFCSLSQRGKICVTGNMVPYNGNCGAPKSNPLFQTGDWGQIVTDKHGQIQLVVENTSSESNVMINGKLVDLEDMTRQIRRQDHLIKDCFSFVCQRGKDVPQIVVATLTPKDCRYDRIQNEIMEKQPMVSVAFPTSKAIPKITKFLNDEEAVDLRRMRALHFQHLGRTDSKKWKAVIPPRNPYDSSTFLNATQSSTDPGEKNIKIICNAVAFSFGMNLDQVMECFRDNFWEIGATPVRMIMTIRSCLYLGRKLRVEDFIAGKSVSELASRLTMAEKEEVKWTEDVCTIQQMFTYSRITKSDHKEITEIVTANLSGIVNNQKEIEKYASEIISCFDNSLRPIVLATSSTVALVPESRDIVGVAFSYRGNLRTQYIPPQLQEGFDLFTSVIQRCRHLTKGIEAKDLAKSYLVLLKDSPPFHPSKKTLLLRDLLFESMKNAQSIGCRGFIVCTADTLVQEISCTLLGFETLLEIQLNLHKNKKLQKPFLQMDDHQMMGVYFKKLP